MSSTHHRLRRLGASLSCALLLSGGLGIAAGTAGAASSVDAPICPAATANGRFVRFLYLQILMRCPDAAGGAYWTAKLDHGSARSAVADALDMSTENVVDNNVVPLYQGLLGRAPSSTELAAGVSSIRSTHGDAELIAGLRPGKSPGCFTEFDTIGSIAIDVAGCRGPIGYSRLRPDRSQAALLPLAGRYGLPSTMVQPAPAPQGL